MNTIRGLALVPLPPTFRSYYVSPHLRFRNHNRLWLGQVSACGSWHRCGFADNMPIPRLWLVQTNLISEKRLCPRQRSCPGQVACSKKVRILSKKTAPDSEAARDKWLVQKSPNFEKQICPRQRSCPRHVVCYKKIRFRETVLPQAAKLPGTSGLLKKRSDF